MEQKHPLELFFSSQHPLSRYLSVRVTEASGGVVAVATEVSENFVSDPESGEVHSGFATLVIDSVFGGAVMGGIEKLQPIATTGLTVQHMRRARRGEKLVCNARLEGIYHGIAYVAGNLAVADSGEVLSTAIGTFMVGTRSKPLGVRV